MSPTVEVSPFARLNETGPVEWVFAAFAFQRPQLHGSERLTAALAALQTRVVGDHQLARQVVAHRPQAHHERLRSGQDERAPQAVDAFAVLHFSYAAVACRPSAPRAPPQAH